MTDHIDRKVFTKAFKNINAQYREILKCRDDIIYFVEHYVKMPNGDNIVLKNWQKEYLVHLVDGNDAMLSDKRQAGKTTINAIYVIWAAIFHSYSRCTFITHNKQMSSYVSKFMINILSLLPQWLCSTRKIDMFKKTRIYFNNRSDIVVSSANGDFCGYLPGRTLVLDDIELYSENNFDNAYCGLIPILKSYKAGQLIMTYSSDSNTQQISELIVNAAVRGQLFFGEIKQF